MRQRVQKKPIRRLCDGACGADRRHRHCGQRACGGASAGSTRATGGGLIAPTQGVRLDVVEQLTKLADLKDRGVLTDEEFAAQKAKLLGV